MKRIVIVFTGFGFLFALILLRLFYWQLISYGKLSAEASDQHFFKLLLPAKRGEILSSDGSPLVTNQMAYLVYAEPKKIKDKPDFVKKISEIITVDSEDLLNRISQDAIVWATVGRKIEKDK